MRSALTLLLQLFLLLPAFSQKNPSNKQTRTLFSIRAVDDRTSAELPTQFTINAHLAKKRFVGKSQHNRGFEFILTRTDTLTVIASAPGYYVAEELMVVHCDTCADYQYVVRLEKEAPKSAQVEADTVFRNLVINQSFQLDNVYFDQSSYVLRPESYPQLNKLAKTLAATPGLVIKIAGHTDNEGDRRLNQTLSENRAKIIRTYLIRSGIDERRLQHNGYGDKHPAAPNDSEENKRKNRRVEFVVVAL